MLGFGGRESVIIDLANGLQKNGNNVQIVTLSNNENGQSSRLHKYIQLFQLPSTYKGLGGIGAVIFWIRCLPVFIRLLKKEKPDIVHTHLFFHRLLFAAVAIKLSNIKTTHCQTVHTSGLFYAVKGIGNTIRLRTEKCAVALTKAFLIAISDEVHKNSLKHFSGISSGIQTIFNGVDDTKFDHRLRGKVSKTSFGFQENEIILTYVARITEGKDHLTLLTAWKEIAEQVPQAKLCLAGEGELKKQMQAYCKGEKIEDSVFFLGTVKDIPKLLAITDIGVFTSLFEGFGIAVFEQMFMKIPVILTNIPPFTGLIKKGNGFLFEPGDSECLCNAMLKLINDKQLRKTVGEAGYESVQKFSIDETIKKHEEMYALVQAS